MNSLWKLCPLLLIVLATCIDEGLGIKCWSCRSEFDSNCADPFNNLTIPLTDCNEEPDLPHLPGVRPSMCRKIRQNVDGNWKYFRTCAYLGEPGIAGDEKSCVMRTETNNVLMEYCTCNSQDGCNTGQTVYSNQFVITFAGLVTLFIGCFYNK